MKGVLLDTHALIWYLSGSARLSEKARQFIKQSLKNRAPIFISAISVLEIIYLVEKGKIPETALDRVREALSGSGFGMASLPLNAEVAFCASRLPRNIVPDMPDRIIAATALHFALPLVTRDARIRATGLETIW